MSTGFIFTSPDGAKIAAAALVDRDHGPIVWLQADGYIPLDRLDEFIDALRTIKPGESNG